LNYEIDDIDREFQHKKRIRNNLNSFKNGDNRNFEISVSLQRFDAQGNSQYTIVIDSNGNYEYNGIRNVYVFGEKTGKITQREFKDLLDKLEQIYFFSGDSKEVALDQIDLGYSKLSVSIIQDTIEKIVSDKKFKDSDLRKLKNYIERMIGADQWIYKE